MKNFRFTLCIEGPELSSTELESSLFDAGCDDATLSIQGEQGYLQFNREASNMEQAVVSAMNQIERSGLDLKVSRM